MRYLILLLLLCGCQTPRQEYSRFIEKYNLTPVPIEYNWLPLKTYPHNKDGKIIINATALSGYKVCEFEIKAHEHGHILGLPHCKKESCLMYYKLHRIHILNKTLCRECEDKLCR